jgi:phage repressor protein C with HTH and peptisase S24 domain
MEFCHMVPKKNADEDMQIALGSRIATAVKAAGGPSEVARRAGIPLRSLNNYLIGKSSPPALVLARIAAVCGQSLTALMDNLDEELDAVRRNQARLLRLREAIMRTGSPGAAASRLRVPRVWVSLWLSGEMQPNDEQLVSLGEMVGVSLDWLKNGGDKDERSNRSAIAHVPLLDVMASAGHGGFNDTEEVTERIPFRVDDLRAMGLVPSRLHAIRAKGDSMEPTIADGALVLIDTSSRDVRSDGIYAIDVNDQIKIKRVSRNLDGSVTILSDASDRYPPERIDKDDLAFFRIIGRVVWTERVL